MPRITKEFDPPRHKRGRRVDRLAEELKNNTPSGQPLIYEQKFPSQKLRVIVIWDEWAGLTYEERTETILSAYVKAEGQGATDKVPLASGLTAPEAHGAGILPFEVLALHRRDDPVSLKACQEAMAAEGATSLLGPDKPRLWFATLEEAEAARRRLVERLPGSDQIWAINEELDRVIEESPE